MKSGWLRASIAVAMLFSTRLAVADTPDEDAAASQKAAREWADKGKACFDLEEYACAIEALTEAEKHLRAPTFVHLSALAHEKLGRLVEARRLHQSIVDMALPSDAPPVWVNARKSAESALLALDARIPKLEVVVANPGSLPLEVTLDGARLGAGDLGRPLARDPGKHTLVVKAPGHAGLSREVVLREGATERVALQLPAGAAPLAPTAPASTPLFPAADGDTSAAPGPRLGARRIAGYTALGAGGAALVVGAVMGGVALVKYDDVRARCGPQFDLGPCRTDRSGALGEARTFADVSTAGFAVAAAGVAVGTVLVLWPKPSSSARVVARAGFVTLEGEFR